MEKNHQFNGIKMTFQCLKSEVHFVIKLEIEHLCFFRFILSKNLQHLVNSKMKKQLYIFIS